jgi:hypothetical protein
VSVQAVVSYVRAVFVGGSVGSCLVRVVRSVSEIVYVQ